MGNAASARDKMGHSAADGGPAARVGRGWPRRRLSAPPPGASATARGLGQVTTALLRPLGCSALASAPGQWLLSPPQGPSPCHCIVAPHTPPQKPRYPRALQTCSLPRGQRAPRMGAGTRLCLSTPCTSQTDVHLSTHLSIICLPLKQKLPEGRDPLCPWHRPGARHTAGTQMQRVPALRKSRKCPPARGPCPPPQDADERAASAAGREVGGVRSGGI